MAEEISCSSSTSNAQVFDLESGLEPSEFIVTFGETASFSWPEFITSHDYCDDVADQIDYAIYVYNCSTCADPTACDRDSDTDCEYW